MNIEYIIMGMEFKDGGGKGIYSFQWTEVDAKEIPQSYVQKESPDYLVETESNALTPRHVKCFDDKICVITRMDLQRLSMSKGIIKEYSRRELSDLFTDEAVKEEFKRDFQGNELLKASMSKTDNGDCFLALYLPRTLKKDKPDRKDGFLLYSQSGNLDDFYLVQKCNPTGQIVAKNNSVLVSSGRRVIQFVKEKGVYVEREHFDDLKGNVISIAHQDGFTVCTDDRWGYILDYQGNTQRFCPVDKFNFLKDDPEQLYLPATKATSSLFVSYRDNMYLLFGLGDGKLLIHTVSLDERKPKVQFCNLVNFLTENASINEANKDNNIYSLQEQSGFVSFVLRNHYLRLGINNLLNCAQNGNDSESKKFPASFKEHYLSKLLEFNGVAYGVPHRITSWDLLFVKGVVT